MMELNTASPKNSRRSLFSSAPSLTERWLNAVLYNDTSPGVKPSTLFSCFLNAFFLGSVSKISLKNCSVLIRKSLTEINDYLDATKYRNFLIRITLTTTRIFITNCTNCFSFRLKS